MLLSTGIYGSVRGRGGQPGAFMSWGAGARSLGMGKAFVALADDASATYWNPAGLGQLERKEVTALHAFLWGGTVYDFISYAHPVPGLGTIGMSGTRLFLGGFEGRDVNNVFTRSFENTQSAYGFSYGRQVIDTLAMGANVKYFSHTLDNYHTGNYIIDVAMLYKPPMDNTQLGFNMQNLLSIKTGQETADKLPLNLRLGGRIKMLHDHLVIAADVNTDRAGMAYHLGAEYWAFEYLAIRLGMDAEEFTLGFGVQYQDYGIDYAFASHDLGASHRFSATMRFGTSITEESQMRALENYKEGMAAYQKGLYRRSSERFMRSLSMDPANAEAKEKFNRMAVVSKVVPVMTEEGRVPQLFRQGVDSYMAGDAGAFINVLRYIISIEPDNRRMEALLREVKKAEGIQEEETRRPGMSMVDQKLYRALEHFYEGKYDLTVKEAQDVLLLEPNNALAYKRIGSAYFAIGQRQKAIEAWEKSLALDPTDTSLQEFVDNVKKGLVR